MSNIIFRLIIFSLIFNVATGIIMEAIPAFVAAENDNVVSGEGGLTYTKNGTSVFIDTMSDQVNPSGNMENKADAIDRLLDTIGIGYIKKFLSVVEHYLYGFVNLLNNMLGGYLPAGVHSILFDKPFGLLYIITTIGYILGGYSLWTGRGIRVIR